MTLIFLRRVGLILLLFISSGSLRATAGSVFLYMALDPPTTAGFGVSTVPRADSTGTFSVTSNKSGLGTFHLYALDVGTDSFGIAYFSIALSGTVSNVFNRSPIGSFATLDEGGNSIGDGNAGFSDGLLRSGNNQNPLQGAQVIGSLNRIGGMGQTANNLNNTPHLPAIPAGGSRSWSAVTSGQWGNYATAYPGGDPTGLGRKWLLLGEGNYTGSVPLVNEASSTVLYYSRSDFNSQDSAIIGGSAAYIDNVDANKPGMVTFDLSSRYTGPPPNQFHFIGYKPPAGVFSAPPLAHPATLDPITKQFRWDTTGATLGEYSWHSAYLDSFTQDWNPHVDITVRITAIPEPNTISLLGLALAILCNRNRPRR